MSDCGCGRKLDGVFQPEDEAHFRRLSEHLAVILEAWTAMR